MIERPSTPRVAPLPFDERPHIVREVLGDAFESDNNLSGTLERAPDLYRTWLPFVGQFFQGRLAPRERELVTLRTGWNCRSKYEWGQHVEFGLKAGLTREEIDRIPAGPDAGWEPFDAVSLRAVDELHTDACLTDATWHAVRERFDDAQVIELLMLIGQFHLVAMTVNSLGVPLDEGLSGLPG